MDKVKDVIAAQARREAAVLLGVNIENPSPADALRIDMISALRLVIDAEQGAILSGGSADLSKLNVAVQSLIALLPGSKLDEPASSRPDPRKAMWETYLSMRRRGELADPTSTYEGRGRRIAELEAEVAALKAGVPAPGESTAPPLPDSVVKLSTRVDNPSPPAAPPKPPQQPQAAPTYNTNSEWKDYVNSDGSIRSTPRGVGSFSGKDWGPVG
jgi:hypothetical protein